MQRIPSSVPHAKVLFLKSTVLEMRWSGPGCTLLLSGSWWCIHAWFISHQQCMRPRVLLMTKGGFSDLMGVSVFLLLSFACWRKIFQLHFSVPPLSTPWDPYGRVISYVGWNIWGCPIWVPCSLLPSCISVVHFCVALNNTEAVALPCYVLSIGSPSVCVWENLWKIKDHMWNRTKT